MISAARCFLAGTPYLGAGIGLSRIEIDYSAISTRRDEAALSALDPPRHPAAANQSSIADKTLSDWLWGYQLMAGMDYALGEHRVLSAKLRYGSTLGDFRDDGHPWRSLRGHASTVAPGGGSSALRNFDTRPKVLGHLARFSPPFLST